MALIRLALTALAAVTLSSTPAALAAPADGGGVRRFALVVGANNGGADRVRLRFAVSDAHTFASVMGQLGGVAPNDTLLLEEPSRERFLAGLRELDGRVKTAKQAHRRTELVLYYSGHSDETGLLLGAERLGYRDLRAGINALGADVKIAILDSCASGALLREKGGRRVAPFLVDDASQISGHAFLTSSSADESAQESDRLGASFFTHHLVSGLRGAADVSGDGRVTLNEAYQFAFHETLARTEHTKSGPQHPNYDIDLSGSGDVVITDLSQLSSVLVLDAPLVGRFFVRDSSDRLVAEVQKSGTQRAVELGLEAGVYRIAFTEAGVIWVLVTELPSGRRVVLRRNMFATDGAAVAYRDRGAEQDGGDDGAEDDEEGRPWPDDGVQGELPPNDDPAPPEDGLEDPTVIHDDDGADDGPSPDVTALRLSLVPGLSLNGPGGNEVVNGFAFGLIGDGVLGVRGAQLTTAVGIVDNFIDGAQITGGVNIAGGSVYGAQVSGGANIVGGWVHGAQVTGGANIAGEEVVGAQISGGLNIAGGWLDGLQATGGVNLAGASGRGAQVAGGVNIVDGAFEGAQVAGGVNIAGDVDGVQIGIVNIGGRVRGAQIGVVNIAEHIDGVSLGLVPIVADGYNHLEAWGDTALPFNLGVRLGAPLLHMVLSVGTNSFDGSNACVMRLGGGLGSHVDVGAVYLDFDLTGHGLAGKGCDWNHYADDEVLTQLRVTLGLPLTEALAVFVGAGVNAEVRLHDNDLSGPLLSDDLMQVGEPWSARFSGSLFAGVRLF